MIIPEKRFDTIMEEYIAKRAEFDGAKKGLETGAGAAGGAGADTSKVEIEALKNKIDLLLKT